jgi:protease-4
MQRLRPARSSEDPAAAAIAGPVAEWGALAGPAALLGLPDAGPLLMPGVRLR